MSAMLITFRKKKKKTEKCEKRKISGKKDCLRKQFYNPTTSAFFGMTKPLYMKGVTKVYAHLT